MRPLVSILMPCYNAEKYLRFSLESILNQHYNNLEVICINDGSTDNTLNLLKEYQTADTRITIVNNESNIGLIDSLNKGIHFVHGEFFARMDADDYSHPDRIQKEMAFLRKNPSVDLVSSGYHYFIEDGVKLEYVPPVATLPNSLKFTTLFSTPFTHGAVLGRSHLIRSGLFRYDKNYIHSEDYELFSRLAWQGVTIANLDEPLYWLRINPNSVSVVFNSLQNEMHLKITKRNLEEHLHVSERLRDTILRTLSNRINSKITAKELRTTLTFLEHCFELTREHITYSEEELRQIRRYLSLHGLNILIQSNKVGLRLTGMRQLPYFFSSFFRLRPGHFNPAFVKLYNYLRHRLLSKN